MASLGPMQGFLCQIPDFSFLFLFFFCLYCPKWPRLPYTEIQKPAINNCRDGDGRPRGTVVRPSFLASISKSWHCRSTFMDFYSLWEWSLCSSPVFSHIRMSSWWFTWHVRLWSSPEGSPTSVHSWKFHPLQPWSTPTPRHGYICSHPSSSSGKLRQYKFRAQHLKVIFLNIQVHASWEFEGGSEEEMGEIKAFIIYSGMPARIKGPSIERRGKARCRMMSLCR